MAGLPSISWSGRRCRPCCWRVPARRRGRHTPQGSWGLATPYLDASGGGGRPDGERLRGPGLRGATWCIVASDMCPEAIVVTLAAQWLGGAAVWLERVGAQSPPSSETLALVEPTLGSGLPLPRVSRSSLRSTLALELPAPFVLGIHASLRGPAPRAPIPRCSRTTP